MNILEYADIINCNLSIRRVPNQNERWIAEFESCETKHGCMLQGTYGNGDTPGKAINDYTTKIRGKKLVINAYSKKYRKEYTVPKSMQYINLIGY